MVLTCTSWSHHPDDNETRILRRTVRNEPVLTNLRFSPGVVWDLEDDEVDDLGAEDDGTIKTRTEMQEKIRVLGDGLEELDAFTARPDTSIKLLN